MVSIPGCVETKLERKKGPNIVKVHPWYIGSGPSIARCA